MSNFKFNTIEEAIKDFYEKNVLCNNVSYVPHLKQTDTYYYRIFSKNCSKINWSKINYAIK